MKNSATQFMFAFMAFVLLSFIMGFAKPAPEQPKRYIIVKAVSTEKIQQDVDQNLLEGWHCEGGVSAQNGALLQAMSK
jgi:hypothetical protein